MKLHRQAERLRCIEDAGDLIRREGDAFAEPIDRVRQSKRGVILRRPVRKVEDMVDD